MVLSVMTLKNLPRNAWQIKDHKFYTNAAPQSYIVMAADETKRTPVFWQDFHFFLRTDETNGFS